MSFSHLSSRKLFFCEGMLLTGRDPLLECGRELALLGACEGRAEEAVEEALAVPAPLPVASALRAGRWRWAGGGGSRDEARPLSHAL